MISWQLLSSVPATFPSLASELTWLTSGFFTATGSRTATSSLRRGSGLRLDTLTVCEAAVCGGGWTPETPGRRDDRTEGPLSDSPQRGEGDRERGVRGEPADNQGGLGRSALQRRCTAEGDTGLNGARVPHVFLTTVIREVNRAGTSWMEIGTTGKSTRSYLFAKLSSGLHYMCRWLQVTCRRGGWEGDDGWMWHPWVELDGVKQ